MTHEKFDVRFKTKPCHLTRNQIETQIKTRDNYEETNQ